MLTRLIGVALLAGLLAGLVTAALQTRLLEPLIVEAEKFEAAPMHHDGMVMPAPATSASMIRIATTAVATAGVAVGYALMLLAAMLATETRITWRSGLLWGACGFAACGLAPAFGLPPSLPGAAEADLTARQVWWIATAFGTAGGLWLLLRGRRAWQTALGLILVAAPHIIGAPGGVAPTSTVPAELAAAFTARSLGLQAVLWLTMAAAAGWLWSRQEGTQP